MAKRRGGYRGRSRRGRSYSPSYSRPSRRGGRRSYRGGASGRQQTVRLVIQQPQAHPGFYVPGMNLPGPAQAPVGFGADGGLALGTPKAAPRRSRF